MPRSVDFQFNVRARVPKGSRVSNRLTSEIVRRWIEGEHIPNRWSVRVVIWSGRSSREISELDDSPRGESLRNTLRSALKSGKIRFKKMGSHR